MSGSEYDKMTVSEAETLLACNLRFGNPKQIHAVHLLELAAELRERKDELEIECATCDGFGTHECDCGHSHSCEDCGGTGYSDGPVTDHLINRMGILEVRSYLDQIREAQHA